MIKTEKAYQEALKKIEKDQNFLQQQKQSLMESAFTYEQIDNVLAPAISFNEQLKEQVAHYEHIKRGEFPPIFNMNEIGKSLIAYRIYIGMNQKELAAKLNVSPAQLSRDERNEYYGASVEKIQRVIDAMGMALTIKIGKPHSENL